MDFGSGRMLLRRIVPISSMTLDTNVLDQKKASCATFPCEISDALTCCEETRKSEYVYVPDQTCEHHGYETITTEEDCKAAGHLLKEGQWSNFINQLSYRGDDRPTGCSYHTFGNVELWRSVDMSNCDVNGYSGCFCKTSVPKTCSEQENCKKAALEMGLKLGGFGFGFAGHYPTKGCYFYESGKYKGIAFYGIGGSEAQQSNPLTLPQKRVTSVQCSAVPKPCSESENCKSAALKLGLRLGSKNHYFIGNYGTKGCYFYESGEYAGSAFYGTGGSVEEKGSKLTLPQIRVADIQCSGEITPTNIPTITTTATPTDDPIKRKQKACSEKENCKSAALKLGLRIGGKGYSFAGNYKTKGCYFYASGKYAGIAYYGTGGSTAEKSTILTLPKQRVADVQCSAVP